MLLNKSICISSFGMFSSPPEDTPGRKGIRVADWEADI